MDWNTLVNWAESDPLHWTLIAVPAILLVVFIVLGIRGGLHLFHILLEILRERRRLTKEIHLAEQRDISKAKSTKQVWKEFTMGMKAKGISSTPISILEKISRDIEKLEEETFQATSDTILFFVPANSKSRLKEKLNVLTALEKKWDDNYGPANIKELEQTLTLYTIEENKEAERKKIEFYEKRDEKKNREILENLKEELSRNLNYLIQRDKNTLMVGETSPTHGSRYLDFGRASRGWYHWLAHLQKLEKEGKTPLSRLIELYESFGGNFVHDQENKISAVELCAMKVVEAEKKLDSIKGALMELKEEMRYSPKAPKDSKEAERILKKELPRKWAHLDSGFKEKLGEVNKLLTSADNTTVDLRQWARQIISWKQRATWLKEKENIITEVHKIKIETRDDWERATDFLDNKALGFWIKLDIDHLEVENNNIETALRLRQDMLANRVYESAEKVRSGQTPGTVSSLDELLKIIIDGFKDKRPITTVNQTRRFVVEGEMWTSPEGTSMPIEQKKSWMGVDAEKKRTNSSNTAKAD